MIKKIIFFVESTFNQRDYNRFGFEILKSRGFEVHVWDFTPLLRSKVYHNYSVPDAIKYKYHELIDDKSDFNKLAEFMDTNVVAVMLISLNTDTKFIFDQLIKTQVLFGFCLLGLIPCKPKQLFEKIISLVQNPKLLLSKLRSSLQIRINAPIYPHFIVAGGKKASQDNRYPKNNHTRLIKTHTLDYDLFLNEEFKGFAPVVNGEYAVFIDEFVPFHPDYLHMNIKPDCSSEDYYPDINRFFDKVESEFDTKVIIAAHPRSDYHKKENPYNRRQCIFNETINLIKYSKFVIVHASTAINFAILYNKAMLFVSSNKYSERYKKSIQFYSSVFEKKPINVGNSITDIDSELIVNKNLYKSYREQYIKEADTPEKPVWEIFVDNIN
jgi:hypothetical protein